MTHRNDKVNRLSTQFYLLASLLLCVFFTTPSLHAQATSDPAPAAAPAASPAPAAPSAQSPASDTPAKPPAKPKHVFTNDDMPSTSSGGTVGKDGKIMPGPSSLLNCDASCEHAARNYLGYDSENEGEWREQIVKARSDLASDNQWRGMLNQGIAQVKYYCNFLAQQSQKTAPSNKSYNAQVQRSQNSEYFEYTERNLRASMEGTMNQMEQRIQEVAVLSRVRAALMYVEADRVWNQGCDELGSR
jgi:hypothetical protein